MSIAAVVTRGFGSFGTIPLVVTRGYLAGSTPPPPSSGQFTVSGIDVRALFLFDNVTAPYSPVSKRTN